MSENVGENLSENVGEVELSQRVELRSKLSWGEVQKMWARFMQMKRK